MCISLPSIFSDRYIEGKNVYAVLTVQFHACRPPCLATRPRPKSQKAPGPAGGPFLPRALPRWLLTCFCAWGCGRREVEYRVTLRIWPPLRVVRLRPVHAAPRTAVPFAAEVPPAGERTSRCAPGPRPRTFGWFLVWGNCGYSCRRRPCPGFCVSARGHFSWINF